MKTVVCKDCGYSIEKKNPGNYYCKNCGETKKFFMIQAFCGSKPNSELYEHDDK